jgi:cell division protein FtsB
MFLLAGFIIGMIAAGAALIGGGLKAAAVSEESKAQEAAARDEAAQTRVETQWKVEDLQTQQKQFLGTQQALIGRSGVKLSSGSPLALLSETGARMSEDVRRMRQQGEWGAEALEAEAEMYKKTRPYQVWGSLLGSLASAGSMLI